MTELNQLTKRQKIEYLIKKNILLSPELLEELDSVEFDRFLKEKTGEEMTILVKEAVSFPEKKREEVNWDELERSKASLEKGSGRAYAQFVNYINEAKAREPEKTEDVKITFSYSKHSRQRTYDDFVSYFNARYKGLERILRNRPELGNAISVSRLKGRDAGVVTIIGMVQEKQKSKNNNLIITLEDQTGSIKVVINKTKEQFQAAADIVHDEVIGVIGMFDKNIIFANKIIWPDIPAFQELKKAPYEAYAAFLSDIHVGSKKFMPEEFNKLIKWTEGSVGSEKHREMAAKTKYIFITGDIVDGVGVYPEQASELEIKDIYEQYRECAELISRIRQDIKIIICPGNHDAMRISEPQPKFSQEIAGPMLKIPNVVCVSNPGIINFGATEAFGGFNLLMYHGYSFDYYIANVESIRKNGGYDRADLVMKFLLQRRHLAPTYTSTLAIPDRDRDHLVIEEVPDFFVCGHLHKCAVANYKTTTMICGSTWQAKTLFQEKVGHKPEPARVPVVNLKTRMATILKFAK